ncbi:glycosyltransferase [Parvularcula sp. ZS-1/3]|uniref:Glycosyltransferase n=1 Tax=Parvularcula mediterranea TaxID=2732508 RepID=A0A7Y3W5L9_9PROT|nr:glycosyltransferase [Parvularcula mediterranea]NNU16643.1 glycosyltransferase [Parvularcula mediterranea]
MRIAFFVGAFPMTSETFVVNAAKKILDAGHDLDIYAVDPTSRQTSDVQETVARYGMIERTRSPDVPHSDLLKLPAVLSAFAKTLGREGAGALRLLTTRSLDGLRTAARAVFDASALKKGAEYDVIHVHFGQLAGRVLHLRRTGLLKGKVLVHFRGSDISSHVQAQGDDVYANVFEEADGFVSNCAFFRNKAVRLGAPAEMTGILVSGLDTSNFPYSPRTIPKEGPVKLISVGRLVEKKGFGDVIEALPEVLKHHDVHYTLIGDGILRAPFEKRIAELGIGDHITFLGAQSLDTVARELKASHIFLGPSVTAPDGNQDAPINTLKEAMASGTPVIGTTHGGIPELVEDGVSGYLVPEYDPPAIAEALTRLISESDRWPEMGRRGADKVLEDYDLEKTGETMLGFYRKLMTPGATFA